MHEISKFEIRLTHKLIKFVSARDQVTRKIQTHIAECLAITNALQSELFNSDTSIALSAAVIAKLSNKAIVFQQQFKTALVNDLQTPQAVGVMWDMIKSDISNDEKYFLLLDFDKVFGLNLIDITEEKIDANIIILAERRLKARKKRDFDASDRLRIKIEKAGFKIEDKGDSYTIKKQLND